MCGIVAAIGDLSVKEEKIFKDLLQMDVLRGKDSTGVIKISGTAEVSHIKALGSPQELMDMKKFDNIMAGKNIALIGHNRAATVGKVIKANAHPFEADHIIGVHNGTLRNKYILPDHTDYAVDSENLFHAIALNGLKETIKKVDGAYTLSYVDVKEKSINFLRNSERPMCFTSSEDGKVTFFASEGWMLEGALSRNKYKHRPISIMREHTLVKIPYDTGGIKKWEIEQNIPSYEPPPVKKYQHSSTVSSSPYNVRARAFLSGCIDKVVSISYGHTTLPSGVHAQGFQTFTVQDPASNNLYNLRLYGEATKKYFGEKYTGVIKKVKSEGGAVWGVLDRRSLVKKPHLVQDNTKKLENKEEEPVCIGFKGKLLTSKEFKESTKQGCSWCTDTVTEKDAGDIEFISSVEFICKNCKHEEEVRQYIN